MVISNILEPDHGKSNLDGGAVILLCEVTTVSYTRDYDLDEALQLTCEREKQS